jgi:2-polyprenyl-3-methyl-5-hydroxy-6-metoxy-1,4-benzoquinol methylase
VATIEQELGGAAWFAGRAGLEVGCGYADIGGHFVTLGARMLCTDARAQHLNVARRKNPGVDFAICDLDKEFPKGRYDFVLHLGVLYHMAEPLTQLRLALETHPSARFIIETEVCNVASDEFVLLLGEAGYDGAFNGIGGRPSTCAVERVIGETGRSFRRLDDSR